MKIVGLSGSIVGSKTRTAMNYTMKTMEEKYPDIEVSLIDLAEYDIQFSDGRNYTEYEGDTKYDTKSLMEAEARILGTPILQASMPGPRKNILDLIPINAFQENDVS